MVADPKPRRWSFTLRTLLALVTLAGGVLGCVAWQVKIVRERYTIEAYVESHGGYVSHKQMVIGYTNGPWQPKRLPWYRRWLGDSYTEYVELPRDGAVPKDELLRIRRAFPEAQIYSYGRWLNPAD